MTIVDYILAMILLAVLIHAIYIVDKKTLTTLNVVISTIELIVALIIVVCTCKGGYNAFKNFI